MHAKRRTMEPSNARGSQIENYTADPISTCSIQNCPIQNV